MTVPELKPCPFCGGEASHAVGKTGSGKPWHYVECDDCGAAGPSVEYAWHNIAVLEANAEAWNTRVTESEIERLRAEVKRARVAALREALLMAEGAIVGGQDAYDTYRMIRDLIGKEAGP